MFVKNLLGRVQIGAFLDGHQVVPGHDRRNQLMRILDEAKVTIGENTDQVAALGHRNTGNGKP